MLRPGSLGGPRRIVRLVEQCPERVRRALRVEQNVVETPHATEGCEKAIEAPAITQPDESRVLLEPICPAQLPTAVRVLPQERNQLVDRIGCGSQFITHTQIMPRSGDIPEHWGRRVSQPLVLC